MKIFLKRYCRIVQLLAFKFAALTTVMLGIVITSAQAQNFENSTGGTYVAGPNAKIIMQSATGQFTGSAQLGTSGTRIPGMVEWRRSASTQTMQALYYTNLSTSGSAVKTVGAAANDTVHVDSLYTPSGGNRDYTTNTTIFLYDGSDGVQTIAAESPRNSSGYNILGAVGTSAKTTENDTVKVVDLFLHAEGAFTVDTGSVLNLGTNVASVSSADFTNRGRLAGGAGGVMTFDGTFTNNNSGGTKGVFGAVGAGLTPSSIFHFTSTATNTAGNITLGAGDSVQVDNAFVRTAGTFAFDATSKFGYAATSGNSATSKIVATGAGFAQYGTLSLTGSNAKEAAGEIAIAGNLYIVQPLNMESTSANDTLKMLTASTDITFADDTLEINGLVKRTGFTTSTAYNFNNRNTQLAFSTPPTEFALRVNPNTTPTNTNDFDPTKDIKRTVTAGFSGTGAVSSMKVYYDAEDMALFTGDETKTRFTEGFSSSDSVQKVAALNGTTTRSTTAPRFLSLASDGTNHINLVAGSTGGTVQQLTSGSNLIITTKPRTVLSIAKGRWSNPATWDVGAMPDSSDDVVVKNTVWTGIDQAAYGGSAFALNEIDGSSNTTDAGASANSILIDNVADAALIIGNSDADITSSVLFRTRLKDGRGWLGIRNTNTNATASAENLATATGINGLWTLTTNAGKTPQLGTLHLLNEGKLSNYGNIFAGIDE